MTQGQSGRATGFSVVFDVTNRFLMVFECLLVVFDFVEMSLCLEG